VHVNAFVKDKKITQNVRIYMFNSLCNEIV